MQQKDKNILSSVKNWLENEFSREEKEEIDLSLHDIKYDVENFIEGIRFHTERFRDEIGKTMDTSLEALQKNQFISRGEFLREIKKRVSSIEKDKEIPIAFSIIGNCLFFLEAYDLAGKCFERSIAYLPLVAAFHNNLGCCYFKQKRWLKAKRAFRKALDLQPDYKEAEKNLHDAAREHSNQRRIISWMSRGNRYFLENAWEKAEACYEKALEIGGQMPETLVNLGNVHFRKGGDAKAEEFFVQAIQESPDYAAAYSSLGKLRLRQGHLKEAFVNLQKAFELDPTLHDSLALLGDISFKWGNYPQALELYEAYLRQHPDSSTTLMLIGDCYLKMGKTEAARLAYETLKKRGMESEALEKRLDLVKSA